MQEARVTDARNPKAEEGTRERERTEEKMWDGFIVIKFYGTPTSHLH